MRKLTLFLLCVAVVVIAVLAASKFVAGFDQAAYNGVVVPFAGALNTLKTSIVTSPLWIKWGHFISFVSGIVVTVFFAVWLWPRMPKRKVTEKAFKPMGPPTTVVTYSTPPPATPKTQTTAKTTKTTETSTTPPPETSKEQPAEESEK